MNFNENTRCHVIEFKNKVIVENDLADMKWFYANDCEDDVY